MNKYFVLLLFLGLQSTFLLAEKKDKMVYGETGRLDSYDPYTVHEVSGQRLSDLIFDSLIEISPTGEYQSSLADSWEINKNNTSIIMTLKNKTAWHGDKKEVHYLTAKDVINTVRLIKAEGSEIPNAERFNIIANVQEISSNKIRINLSRATVDPLRYLSFKILPAHKTASLTSLKRNSDFAIKPIGTGPYQFISSNSQGEVLLKANKKYYKGSPEIETILMKSYANQNIMSQSLMYNSLDLITYVSPRDLNEIKGDKKLSTVAYDALSYSFIGFNTSRGVLKDKRVRQAISVAINRQEMLDAFFQGQGQLITGPFPPTSWAYNIDVPATEFSIERAKGLMQNAGIKFAKDGGALTPTGEKINLIFAVPLSGESEIIKRIVLAYQGYLNEIGINLDLQFMDWQVWKQKVLGQHDYDLTIASWSFDDSSNISSLFHSSSAKEWGNNFVMYKNPQIDSLLTEASVTNDFDKKRAINHKIHSILADEVPYTYLWTLKHHAAHSVSLSGVRVEPFSFFKHIASWKFKDSGDHNGKDK